MVKGGSLRLSLCPGLGLLLLLFLCLVSLSACSREKRGELSSYTLKLPNDASVLDRFAGDRREQLLRYLASNAIWCVGPASLKPCGKPRGLPSWQSSRALLRCTPSYFLADKESFKKKAVSELLHPDANYAPQGSQCYITIPYGGGGNCTIDKETCYLTVALQVRGDKEAEGPAAPRTCTIQVDDSGEASSKGNIWSHSYLVASGHDLCLSIEEHSYRADRKHTKEALAFVLSELEAIADQLDGEKESASKTGQAPPVSLLAEGSVKQLAADEIKVGSSCLFGYFNPGESGVLKLSLVPGPTAVKNAYHWGTDGEQEVFVRCGWSDKPDERYFFAIPWCLPGDGDANINQFNLRLTFKPDRNSESKEAMAQRQLYYAPARQ
ncbi:MAG: hypothetical protein SFV17_04265 [Candidatus Obscuribacter sp.]|nr:hypothetical protein [Candidatus Melainabacteria bacterium]MDX1985882.1 hypothetical protein [Candidatus Obscuribacter sp.]